LSFLICQKKKKPAFYTNHIFSVSSSAISELLLLGAYEMRQTNNKHVDVRIIIIFLSHKQTINMLV